MITPLVLEPLTNLFRRRLILIADDNRDLAISLSILLKLVGFDEDQPHQRNRLRAERGSSSVVVHQHLEGGALLLFAADLGDLVECPDCFGIPLRDLLFRHGECLAVDLDRAKRGAGRRSNSNRVKRSAPGEPVSIDA
jgi:hypothetical protein